MTDLRDSGRVLDRDLAPVASLIGDPTRIAILAALAEGHALPAGELAHRAGVHPATATAHLRQLVDGGLVSVRVQGRHRYHELAGPGVAAVVEALAQLAPATPVRSLRSDIARPGISPRRERATTTLQAGEESNYATGCSPSTRCRWSTTAITGSRRVGIGWWATWESMRGN